MPFFWGLDAPCPPALLSGTLVRPRELYDPPYATSKWLCPAFCPILSFCIRALLFSFSCDNYFIYLHSWECDPLHVSEGKPAYSLENLQHSMSVWTKKSFICSLQDILLGVGNMGPLACRLVRRRLILPSSVLTHPHVQIGDPRHGDDHYCLLSSYCAQGTLA